MTTLTEQPTVAITISEEFPLIACRECSARYVLIAIVGEGNWMAQTGGYYCPYCGHKVEGGQISGWDSTPNLTVTIDGATAGTRHYILIECFDNDQEITIPAGWRLERDYRWFNQKKYKALISHIQTGNDSYKTVVIGLKNDTLAAAHVVSEDQIESLFKESQP